MYWNLIINFDWNIIEIEIAKYKHSTELSCNITTLPVGLSDTQMGVCRVYVFMYGLRRLSRVEVICTCFITFKVSAKVVHFWSKTF